jgi:hypothetical protein
MTNVLVTGTTGSGKTSGVMLPALRRLIETGCSGIVLTAKEAHAGIAEEYPDRIVVIGASDDAEPVNLIGDLATETQRARLDTLRGDLRIREDSYWGLRAIEYALSASHQLRQAGGRYALCTMCVGVSQGIATLIERV